MTTRSQPARAASRSRSAAPPASGLPTRSASRTVPAPPKPAPKKTGLASRKPLAARANSPDVAPPPSPRKPTPPNTKIKPVLITVPDSDDREPVKAFLRIRPQLGDAAPSSAPYLSPLSNTAVRMTDPTRAGAPADYTFSHVFPPDTLQAPFFTQTTLPLVRDLLVDGRNGLLFAYGVTNSGKTYTVQGGTAPGSAGILPRTLDVIFNSIQGLEGDVNFRPVRLQGLEPYDPASDPELPPDDDIRNAPALADVLAELEPTTADADIDPTALAVDRNYAYSLWLSYAEVYNEKVYDLLAPSQPSAAPADGSRIPRAPAPVTAPGALLLTRKALALRTSPPGDADADADGDGGAAAGKYAAGLRQVRVRSAAAAKALLRRGQVHRRVFGTLANAQSSRSHGVVTLKLLRRHRGERVDDASAVQTARLTLVDLAGSERTKHTHTTGARLREAGAINKSLMVLGQCMEVLRANQRRVAQSLASTTASAATPGSAIPAPGAAAGVRTDTRDVKRALQVVPFRHSRLTELLMDYFVADARAAMIVNVNPYDTGFDENAHVMRFAAIAREVSTAYVPGPRASAAGVRRSVVAGGRASDLGHGQPPGAVGQGPATRKVTLSIGGKGRKASQALLEVLEEDEEMFAVDDADLYDEQPADALIDTLFDEIEHLRMQLFESEMRCAVVEAETREEVMHEMEERMHHMERMHARRLMNEVEQSEMKTDAKIEMLHRSGMFGRAPGPARGAGAVTRIAEEPEDVDMDVDITGVDDEEMFVEMSLREDEYMNDAEVPGEQDEEEENMFQLGRRSMGSPLQGKEKGKGKAPSKAKPAPKAKASPTPVRNDEDDAEWVYEPDIAEVDAPPAPKPLKVAAQRRVSKTASKARKPSAAAEVIDVDMPPALPAVAAARAAVMTDADDDVLVIPNKAARKAATALGGPEVEYVPGKGEVDTVKKKKRQLGKNRVVTGDQIERIVEQALEPEGARTVRRATRARTTGS